MNKKVLLLLVASCTIWTATAQQKQQKVVEKEVIMEVEKKKETTSAQPLSLNPDMQQISSGEVTIKGQKVPYKTVTGTMPVWDEEGNVVAGVFFKY